ncbi:MAG: exodeoxyribonuclease VII small subunit [Bacteroidota bacterium]
MEAESFSFEKNLEKIRSLVEILQKGSGTFDEQLDVMQEGLERIKQSHAYLDEAEMKIEQLIKGNWEEFPSDTSGN